MTRHLTKEDHDVGNEAVSRILRLWQVRGLPSMYQRLLIDGYSISINEANIIYVVSPHFTTVLFARCRPTSILDVDIPRCRDGLIPLLDRTLVLDELAHL
ncbi:MAG: hypothetical protein AB7L09_02255 [Nitrospira sp.]